MAVIVKRTGKDGTITYQARIRLRGQPQQSATFSTRSKAKEWAHATESAMREGRHFKTSESKKHTVGDMIDRYIAEVLPLKLKSLDKQKAQLIWWKAQIGYRLLADVSSSLIAECRDRLLKETTYRGTPRSGSTAIRYLSALSHAFSIAQRDWEWVQDNPVRRISRPKESRGRVRFLSDEERVSLLQVCQQSSHPYLYIIVVLAISTGMRQGEILTLTWNDIDLDKGRIILQMTKNGDRRRVAVAGLALDLLRQLASRTPDRKSWIFPGRDPLQPMTIRAAWDTAVRKAELKDFHFHDLRHSAASYLAMGGATPGEIAEILGHRTLQMVKRYSHFSDTHSATVLQKMNHRIFAETSALPETP